MRGHPPNAGKQTFVDHLFDRTSLKRSHNIKPSCHRPNVHHAHKRTQAIDNRRSLQRSNAFTYTLSPPGSDAKPCNLANARKRATARLEHLAKCLVILATRVYACSHWEPPRMIGGSCDEYSSSRPDGAPSVPW